VFNFIKTIAHMHYCQTISAVGWHFTVMQISGDHFN